MDSTQPTFIQQYRYHLIGGGLILATAVGITIWLVRRKRKQKVQSWANTSTPSPTPARTNTGTGFCKSRDYPLGYGNCHPDVIILQTALKALGANLGTYGPNRDGIDGKFGKVTLQAVQSRFGKTIVTREDMEKVKAGLKKWRGR